MDKCEISKATLSRIPAYVKYLDELPEDTSYISAAAIARDLGLGEVQVRKDLSLLCKNGKPKVGYARADLLKSIRCFLNNENGNAVIIGAGQLGKALLEYPGFESYGAKMLAAFDSGIDKTAVLPSGKKIFPMDALPSYCAEHNVKLGVIAVPPQAAQKVLNQLCDCGIKLIWCFAPCRLYKPADVVVQYENLALSLAHLKLQFNNP